MKPQIEYVFNLSRLYLRGLLMLLLLAFVLALVLQAMKIDGWPIVQVLIYALVSSLLIYGPLNLYFGVWVQFSPFELARTLVSLLFAGSGISLLFEEPVPPMSSVVGGGGMTLVSLLLVHGYCVWRTKQAEAVHDVSAAPGASTASDVGTVPGKAEAQSPANHAPAPSSDLEANSRTLESKVSSSANPRGSRAAHALAWSERFLGVALALWLSALLIATAIQRWSGHSLDLLQHSCAVALLLGLLGYAPIKAIQLWRSPAAIRMLDAARVPLAGLFGVAGLQMIQEESGSFWPFLIGSLLAPLLGYVLYRRRAA